MKCLIGLWKEYNDLYRNEKTMMNTKVEEGNGWHGGEN